MADWNKSHYHKVQTQVNNDLWEKIQTAANGNISQWLRQLIMEAFE